MMDEFPKFSDIMQLEKRIYSTSPIVATVGIVKKDGSKVMQRTQYVPRKSQKARNSNTLGSGGRSMYKIESEFASMNGTLYTE